MRIFPIFNNFFYIFLISYFLAYYFNQYWTIIIMGWVTYRMIHLIVRPKFICNTFKKMCSRHARLVARRQLKRVSVTFKCFRDRVIITRSNNPIFHVFRHKLHFSDALELKIASYGEADVNWNGLRINSRVVHN